MCFFIIVHLWLSTKAPRSSNRPNRKSLCQQRLADVLRDGSRAAFCWNVLIFPPGCFFFFCWLWRLKYFTDRILHFGAEWQIILIWGNGDKTSSNPNLPDRSFYLFSINYEGLNIVLKVLSHQQCDPWQHDSNSRHCGLFSSHLCPFATCSPAGSLHSFHSHHVIHNCFTKKAVQSLCRLSPPLAGKVSHELLKKLDTGEVFQSRWNDAKTYWDLLIS